MFLKVKKIIAAVAGIVFVVTLLLFYAAENTFVGYPRIPDEVGGRTVPYAVKGIVVYVTQGEQYFVSVTTWIFIGAALVVLIVFLIHGGDPFRERPLTANVSFRSGNGLTDHSRKLMTLVKIRKIIGVIASIICLAAWVYPIVLTRIFVRLPSVVMGISRDARVKAWICWKRGAGLVAGHFGVRFWIACFQWLGVAETSAWTFNWVCLTFRAKSASEEATSGLVAVRRLRNRTSRA